MDAMRY